MKQTMHHGARRLYVLAFMLVWSPTRLHAENRQTKQKESSTRAIRPDAAKLGDSAYPACQTALLVCPLSCNNSTESGSTPASGGTPDNIPNTLVQRDASGNFAAGVITASLDGAASLNVLKTGDTMTGSLTLAGMTTNLNVGGITTLRDLIATGNTTIRGVLQVKYYYSRSKSQMRKLRLN